MKIYYQESEHDCGVSVTMSLIQHFLKKEVSRTEIFDQLNITPRGLSIFEFEAINKKYGIFLESYKLSIQELEKSDIKDFFVLLLCKDNAEHFVIAKKNKRSCTIYDSEIGKYNLSFQQLSPLFTEKILLIEKIERDNKESSPVNYEPSRIQILQSAKLWRSIGLELIIFIFIVLSYSVNKFIFEDVIQSHHWENISIFIFISVFLLFMWALAEYIKHICHLKDKQWYFKYLYQLFFEKLENKKNYFFSKMEKNNLLMVNQYIQSLSLFYGEILSFCISNSLISFLLALYFIYLQPWLCVLIIILSLIKFLNFYIIKKYDSNYISKLWKWNINSQKLLFSLNHFFKKEWNTQKFLFLNKSLKDEIVHYQLSEKECECKKILHSKLNFFITYLVNIAIYILSCYMYFQKSMGLSSIVLTGIIYSKLNTSLDGIITAGLSWNKFSAALKSFKHLLFNDNILEDKGKLNVELPHQIELKNLSYHNGKKELFNGLNLVIYPNTFLMGSSGIGKSTLYRLIAAKLPNAIESIFFDHIPISNISEKCFNQLLIYQNAQTESTEFEWSLLQRQLNSEQLKTVIELTEQIGISFGQDPSKSKFSDGQRQFINLLNLLQFKQKILLLDEVSSHINQELKQRIYEELFPILQSSNFIVCCDHDLNLSQFFTHQINLNEILNEEKCS